LLGRPREQKESVGFVIGRSSFLHVDGSALSGILRGRILAINHGVNGKKIDTAEGKNTDYNKRSSPSGFLV
jgi:hypothetical protein